MALDGTFDGVPIDGLLALLARSQVTGRLLVEAPGAQGGIDLVGGAAGAGVDAAAVLFEVVRRPGAGFRFRTAAVDGAPGEALADVARRLERLLAEWDEVVALVPSPSSRLGLDPEPPRSTVVVDAARWSVVRALSAGATTSASVAAALGTTEVEACRRVADAVRAGLVRVLAAPVQPALGALSPAAAKALLAVAPEEFAAPSAPTAAPLPAPTAPASAPAAAPVAVPASA